MRRLAQPAVLKTAFLAACVSALACYPRLSGWQQRAHPIWYLEAMILLGGTLLWGFVFAWHEPYSSRPVLAPPKGFQPWAAATAVALCVGGMLFLWLDPKLRLATPQDYPTNLHRWAASTLFHLGFTQLFLVFAPFAWSLRLFRRSDAATVFTVAFGVAVLFLKVHSSPAPLAPSLLGGLIVARLLLGFLTVAIYLRGGILLVAWWGLLIEARHLFHLGPP